MATGRLETCGPQSHAVHFPDGRAVLFSYATPVAAFIPGRIPGGEGNMVCGALMKVPQRERRHVADIERRTVIPGGESVIQDAARKVFWQDNFPQ
jgi:hypothetical protein